MQKLSLKHSLSHKLSPQQLQLIRLLQVPSAAMQARIAAELASNPALEEGGEDDAKNDDTPAEEAWDEDSGDDWASGPSTRSTKQGQQEGKGHAEGRIPAAYSLGEQLLQQLSFLELDEQQRAIGEHLIGSIEPDGYLRRDLESIVNELAFTQYIDTNRDEVEKVLQQIQRFDPPGIGARNLQECLLLQLYKTTSQEPVHTLALSIVQDCFEAFTKKHYDKIIEQLNLKDQQLLRDALGLITKLDPKPGSHLHSAETPQVAPAPDFIVTQHDGGVLQVEMPHYHVPPLKMSKNYVSILNKYSQQKKRDARMEEAAAFAKQKLESARWFIDAIHQRKHTLQKTMEAIVELQHDFFVEEGEQHLKPMVLKHVAEKIGMDVSTVSRIVNNKSVQTSGGVYPLKYFFSEGIATQTGEDVSNRAVKALIKEIIGQEDKRNPLSDEKLAALLGARGYKLARRTVAKYREALELPVARLRKEL